MTKNIKHIETTHPGIYCIRNLKNGNLYIGSSENIYYRLKRHECDLKKNRHGNQHLQNSFNKYGIENFIGFILERCEINKLEQREQYWMDFYNPIYNKRPANRNLPMEKSARLKISETLKRKHIEKNIEVTNNKPVYVFDLFGNYVDYFESMRKCYISLNVSEKEVVMGRRGCVKTPYNYIFSPSMEIENRFKYYIKDIKEDKLYKICNLVKQCKILGLNVKSLEAAIYKNKPYLNRWIKIEKNVI